MSARLLIVLLLLVSSARADSIIDLDRTTPFVFDQYLSIPLGTTLRIGILEVSPIPSIPFDRVGLDLYYEKPGDAVVVPILLPTSSTASSPARAGSLAGLTSTGGSRDLFLPNSFVAPGSVVATGTLPSGPTYLHSVGGVAYDAQILSLRFQNVMNAELAAFDFHFPNVGRVHFTWCGILDGFTGAPTSVPGNIYHDVTSSTPIPTTCVGEVFVDVVPEPSSCFLLIIATSGICSGRKKRRQ